MRAINRLLSLVVIASLSICSAGVSNVLAQDRTITCESTRREYNYCRVDTDNEVRLVRELSFTGCDQGSSWGFDRRGIWVDRGCRAEFAYGRNSGGSGGKTTAIVAGVAGAAILAAILASRKSGSEKYNDSRSVYNFGYDKGQSDAKSNKSSDYGRYRGKYKSDFDSDFIRGYDEGYRGNSSNSGNRNRAYDDGYRRGSQDADDDRRSDYRRYDNEYNSGNEGEFRNGYNDGYRGGSDESDDRHDERGRVPSWLVGTFRGYSMKDRAFYEMTIYPDSTVKFSGPNGSVSYGVFFGNDYLSIKGVNYRVSKRGNGFSALNSSDGIDTVDYTRWS